MEKVIHRAATRGTIDHGWQKTYHTFSYANYYDPRRIHFGALRVLNENVVNGGEGYKSHHHDNMEIMSVVLEGSLEHGDSIGNITIIPAGGVQAITAGTSIIHNEYNKSQADTVRFLQIWIYPREYELSPSYSVAMPGFPGPNELKMIVAPDWDEAPGEIVHINQDAWLHEIAVEAGSSVTYKMHAENNGTYIFVLEGAVSVCGIDMEEKDGMGLWEIDEFSVSALTASKVLLIEVPMRGA